MSDPVDTRPASPDPVRAAPVHAERDAAPRSAWDPLRDGVFRSLWPAVPAGNIGTWMQTAG